MEIADTETPDIVEQAAELVLRASAGEPGAEEEIPKFAAQSPQHLEQLVRNIALHHHLAELGTQLRARASMRRAAMSIAAVILVGLLGLYAYYRPLFALGEPSSFSLSDGSLIKLNGGSIAAPDLNGSRRHVTLWRGEAFFDVEHDLIRPFTVSAGKAIVRAVGTTFDVHLLPSSVTVTVKEGRVELEKQCDSDQNSAHASVNSHGSTVTLEAGQQASVSRDGCIRTSSRLDPAELDRQLAWSKKHLVFENEPLRNVVNQFNRYNRRQLRIRDEAIQNVPVKGEFDSGNLDGFVDVLQYAGVKALFQQGHPQTAAEILLVGNHCDWNGVRCTNQVRP